MSVPMPFSVRLGPPATPARTLFPVALSIDDARQGRVPLLPPLPPGAEGYLVTSLPDHRQSALGFSSGGMLPRVQRRYHRHYVELDGHFDSYMARLPDGAAGRLRERSAATAAISGGGLDVRRYSGRDGLAQFHDIASGMAARSCQDRLSGGGLPDDELFLADLLSRGAAGQALGWVLRIAGEPAAYLHCTLDRGTAVHAHAGHDPAFDDLAPAVVLQAEVIRDLFVEEHIRHFDFAQSGGRLKPALATGGVSCVDVVLLRHAPRRRLAGRVLGPLGRPLRLFATAP